MREVGCAIECDHDRRVDEDARIRGGNGRREVFGVPSTHAAVCAVTRPAGAGWLACAARVEPRRQRLWVGAADAGGWVLTGVAKSESSQHGEKKVTLAPGLAPPGPRRPPSKELRLRGPTSCAGHHHASRGRDAPLHRRGGGAVYMWRMNQEHQSFDEVAALNGHDKAVVSLRTAASGSADGWVTGDASDEVKVVK
uniref:Uncharacterized protein n=1 Tax=Oryza brachyantha TaxID=4533 RepID=J3MM03_ORYBR